MYPMMMPSRAVCTECKTTVQIPADNRSPWVTCPRCLAAVENPAADTVSQPGTIDREVRGDTRKTIGALGILTALLVWGVVAILVLRTGRGDRRYDIALGRPLVVVLLLLFVVLEGFTMVQAVRRLWAGRFRAGQSPALMAIKAVGLVALSVVTLYAIYILFAVVCISVAAVGGVL
jgi:hypothetical protein